MNDRVSAPPWLRVTSPPRPARAVVLVLHGGRVDGRQPVRATSLAALRMVPFARTLTRLGGPRGVAVARLRFRVRGWNGTDRSPVADARWALAELERRFPGLPIGLVGHSMGGRTSIYAADQPSVRSVVLLAPWIEAGDPVETMTGRRVLILHGTDDHTTDPARSAAYAERARRIAEQVTFVEVRGGRHAMLRRAALWQDLAAGFTVGALCNKPANETVDHASTNAGVCTAALTDALAGAPTLVV